MSTIWVINTKINTKKERCNGILSTLWKTLHGEAMLKYTGIDGTVVDKEAIAIKRIKEHEPEEGYYLAFSGGKDSIVIHDLAQRSGVKFDTHFSMTTVDPNEIRQFIKENYPEVIWKRPKRSMFQIIAKRKTPPTRVARYCCSELKEIGGSGRTVITGIRWEESSKRRSRFVYESSTVDKTKMFLNPIIDWKTEDVWRYIKKYQMPYCKLYDEGYTRIGCIMCPVQGTEGMLKDAERFPKYYKAYLRAFGRMLQNFEPPDLPTWKAPEDVMYWWIYGSHDDKTTHQESLSISENVK